MKDVRLEVTDLYWPLDNESIQADDMEFGGFSSLPTCRKLLSAIYLEFYLMVTPLKPLRRCETCGEPFHARERTNSPVMIPVGRTSETSGTVERALASKAPDPLCTKARASPLLKL